MAAADFLDKVEKQTKDQWKRLQQIAAKQLKKYSKVAKKSDHEHRRHEAERNIEIITRALRMAERSFENLSAQLDDMRWRLRPVKKAKKKKVAKKKKAKKH